MLSKFLIEETPGKVVALIGASLFSLAFMFAVSATEASFSGTRAALPNVFSPENVVAVVDTAAASYSKFMAVNFIEPLVADYKIYGENLAWLSEQSGLSSFFGFEGVQQTSLAYGASPILTQGKVAGAQTGSYVSQGSLSVDDLYNVLIR